MTKCIFCKVARGEAPANLRYEDDEIVAFDDINPKAPVHVLVIPKKHLQSTRDLSEKEDELVGRMIRVAVRVAEKTNILDSGYKIIINTGRDSGQLVDHLHLHLLGGKTLERLEV
jgi:histidine triad (HIT) family protein